MSLEPALLAAIAAAPDDDLPRLVYADWLDENDRPLRAEFIRLQIEIAKKETLPRAAVNVFAHLWQRQQEILDNHRDELLGPLVDVAELLEHVEFRRGFVDDITVRADSYFTVGAVVAMLRPLPERVQVTNAARHPEHFFRKVVPGLDAVTDLSLSGDQPNFGGVSEHVPRIRSCSGWPRLRGLDLEGCQLGNMATELLFTFPGAFPALVELDLSFNDLTDAGVIDLLNTGVPQRLKRLVLGGNPIGDQAAMELADRLGGSKVLESLNLRMTNIGPNGQAALLARLGGKVDLF